MRGQVPPFEETFSGLRNGLLLSVVVIFLLLAANFQSFRLTLVVVSAVPAVICGVLIMLWVTGTTLNVQSFMGAIMAIGISVANATLLVTFAESARRGGTPIFDAAVEGGRGRLRAILMTATAMIAGMIPMALASGERGQTAPLGRAVIGGLAAATIATVTVLPAVYAMLQRRAGTVSASLDPDDPASRNYERA
jgi:multidrug efflux pump subunit AcrB